MSLGRALTALIAFLFLFSACQPVTPAPTEVRENGRTPTPTEVDGKENPTLRPTTRPQGLGVTLADLDGTIVTVWHGWGSDKRAAGLATVVEDYNDRNEWGIKVEIIPREGDSELKEAMDAAILSGETPEVVISNGNDLQTWYDKNVLIALNALMENETIGLSQEDQEDFFTAAIQYGITSGDDRVGFALQQSVYVLLYNETWAEELGFSQPPITSYELEEQACQAAETIASDDDPASEGRGGLHLYPEASYVMPWVFAFGGDVVDETRYDFTGTPVRRVANFWKRLLDQGCAFQTAAYPFPENVTPDQLGKREAIFMMDATSRWSQQGSPFSARGDHWKVIPFPGPAGTRAVNVFLPSAAIVNHGPKQEVAAWLFIKHILSPGTQMRWVMESGSFPVRKSAGEMLEDYQRTHPMWMEVWEVLEFGQTEPAKPSWPAVRRALGDAFAVILNEPREDIPATLRELNLVADELEGLD